MTDETILAVYDTAAHADAAIRDLAAANVPSGAISRHAATAGTSATAAREPGFWGKLIGGEPDHDTSVYDRSLDSGSTIVSVRAPEQHVESVSRILALHDPIDINERATGHGAVGGEAILLAEEQLTVGRQLVNRGSTRVHRYVVETPVEQDVTLRSEHLSIERRPAPADAPLPGGFTDRVVEFTETAEEVVVGKTARVKEEVVIRKDAATRVETVHDTVRREDVEVTKDTTAARPDAAASGTVLPVQPKV